MGRPENAARKELQVLTEAAQVLQNALSQGASFFQLSKRMVRRPPEVGKASEAVEPEVKEAGKL